MATTSELLTNLQSDKDRITTAFGLDSNLTFTDIAQKAEDGEIGGGGADLSEYFENSINITSYSSNSGYSALSLIKSIPSNTTISITNLQYAFAGCRNLITMPLIDTSNVTNMNNMFNNCFNLINVPALDTSSVTNMANMFNACQKLSDESLNNILTMCINATNYTGTKTLSAIGFMSIFHSASKIQSLSNYQAFIDAGWTIGY